jgi:hypothetical protein
LSLLLAIYESQTLEIPRENELLKHMESPWISVLINLVRNLEKLMELENTNTVAIIRQTKHQAAYLR